MAIGIDPTVDYAFKLLLGSPEHPAITLHFLNAVLGDEFDITDVEIINPILGKEDDADKLSILDVAATDTTGRRYDIEMQTSLPAGLSQRLAYYTASMYVGQIGEGDDYTLLRPAISICVLEKRKKRKGRATFFHVIVSIADCFGCLLPGFAVAEPGCNETSVFSIRSRSSDRLRFQSAIKDASLKLATGDQRVARTTEPTLTSPRRFR